MVESKFPRISVALQDDSHPVLAYRPDNPLAINTAKLSAAFVRRDGDVVAREERLRFAGVRNVVDTFFPRV